MSTPTTTTSRIDDGWKALMAEAITTNNNNVLPLSDDRYFQLDHGTMQSLSKQRPWLCDEAHPNGDPTYFEHVYISALALIKMMLHAESGRGKEGRLGGAGKAAASDSDKTIDENNWVEVMGFLQGHYAQGAFILTDALATPVCGNETDVQLTDDAMTYLTSYKEYSGKLGAIESIHGYYHSHPGLSCFLSGTDVNNQRECQRTMDPFVALVIDPVRTLALGKVDVRAYRVYPGGTSTSSSSSSNPLSPSHVNKVAAIEERARSVEDIAVTLGRGTTKGNCADQYYEIPMTIFRSEGDAKVLDHLWHLYWSRTFVGGAAGGLSEPGSSSSSSSSSSVGTSSATSSSSSSSSHDAQAAVANKLVNTVNTELEKKMPLMPVLDGGERHSHSRLPTDALLEAYTHVKGLNRATGIELTKNIMTNNVTDELFSR